MKMRPCYVKAIDIVGDDLLVRRHQQFSGFFLLVVCYLLEPGERCVASDLTDLLPPIGLGKDLGCSSKTTRNLL